jgi:DNA-binding HxlR family transcriptional regulator
MNTNHVIFDNSLRSFIIGYLTAKGEATWSELKTAIEKWNDSINPNTLSFHLGKLASSGFLTKIELDNPVFRLKENA